jgi:hypothetical protein
LIKFKNPVVFVAAHAKSGKRYLALMLKHAEGVSKGTHEYVARYIWKDLIWGFAEPTEELKEISPYYKQFTLEKALAGAEKLWTERSMVLLKEWTEDGMVIDADSRFLVIYYYLVKKFIHPDSIRIIHVHRNLANVAHEHCRHGGYRPGNNKGSPVVFMKNATLPWGKNNVTLMEKNILEATPMECTAHYVSELEVRKWLLRPYFPGVKVHEWDMDKDPPSRDSWASLLDFLELKGTGKLWNLVDKNPDIHPAPEKYPHITLEMAQKALQAHNIVKNPNKRPEFML